MTPIAIGISREFRSCAKEVSSNCSLRVLGPSSQTGSVRRCFIETATFLGSDRFRGKWFGDKEVTEAPRAGSPYSTAGEWFRLSTFDQAKISVASRINP